MANVYRGSDSCIGCYVILVAYWNSFFVGINTKVLKYRVLAQNENLKYYSNLGLVANLDATLNLLL